VAENRRYAGLRRYTRPRAYRLKPRHGRIEDRAYLAWLRTQSCVIQIGCARWIEAHHVGRPRHDRRAVPLCALHHRESAEAVHVLGRRAFETRFGVSLEAAIAGLNEEYGLTKGAHYAA